jgi:hypothetical protein
MNKTTCKSKMERGKIWMDTLAPLYSMALKAHFENAHSVHPLFSLYPFVETSIRIPKNFN